MQVSYIIYRFGISGTPLRLGQGLLFNDCRSELAFRIRLDHIPFGAIRGSIVLVL